MALFRRAIESILPEKYDFERYGKQEPLTERQKAAAFRGPYGLSRVVKFDSRPVNGEPTREYVRATHHRWVTGEILEWGDYTLDDRLNNRRPPSTFPAGTADSLMMPATFERIKEAEHGAMVMKALVIAVAAKVAIDHLRTA